MRPGREYDLLTAESVTEGHPDKVADQISDAVLDACLTQDPMSRVAVETMVTRNRVILAGEVTTSAKVDFEETARRVIREIGYDRAEEGFSADTCSVEVLIHEQSPEIAQGVDIGGAGDQGSVFGYATDEYICSIPMQQYLAHRLTWKLAEVRKNGTLPWLRPDGKAQVTVIANSFGPRAVDSVVLAAQHEDNVDTRVIREALTEEVIKPIIPEDYIFDGTRYLINSTGRFVSGGPAADTGLTGRKIIVDTYGGMSPHGGGAFSGKDPTKVDRSAAYMARLIAKSIVANGLSRRALVGLSYAIGVEEPTAVFLCTYGTLISSVKEENLLAMIPRKWLLTPSGIIEYLNLRRPIYSETACYGHFGQAGKKFSWEVPDFISTQATDSAGKRYTIGEKADARRRKEGQLPPHPDAALYLRETNRPSYENEEQRREMFRDLCAGYYYGECKKKKCVKCTNPVWKHWEH